MDELVEERDVVLEEEVEEGGEGGEVEEIVAERVPTTKSIHNKATYATSERDVSRIEGGKVDEPVRVVQAEVFEPKWLRLSLIKIVAYLNSCPNCCGL